MNCVDHVISHAHYVGIYEFAASKIGHRLSGSSSSKIGPSLSQGMLSIASEVIGFSGGISVGEDKSTMFKTHCGPLLIHPRWYELPLGTWRSCDLSVAPSRGEEHNARDTIRIYKDIMREYA